MSATQPPSFSDLIVYVDESGDHGLASREYPVFVLAFCIFEKLAYANTVTSFMHRLKFKHFGHDAVIMHEHDIRRSTGPFSFLMNKPRRDVFLGDMSALIQHAPFTLVAAVIDKTKLAKAYSEPMNPYHLALAFGLERLQNHRDALDDRGRLLVLFESRGKREDDDLELEFRRVCAKNATGKALDFEPLFISKKENHCGLQLADLIARPIGRHYLDPEQANRAYPIIEQKFRRSPAGESRGWGLKCFP